MLNGPIFQRLRIPFCQDGDTGSIPVGTARLIKAKSHRSVIHNGPAHDSYAR